ncbi:unnamed protein product [Ixodes pacificus]
MAQPERDARRPAAPAAPSTSAANRKRSLSLPQDDSVTTACAAAIRRKSSHSLSDNEPVLFPAPDYSSSPPRSPGRTCEPAKRVKGCIDLSDKDSAPSTLWGRRLFQPFKSEPEPKQQKSGQPSPAKSVGLSPAKSGQRSPAKSGQPSPAKSGQPSSAKSGKLSPAKSGQPSPAKTGQRSPAKTGQPPPTKEQPKSSRQLK